LSLRNVGGGDAVIVQLTYADNTHQDGISGEISARQRAGRKSSAVNGFVLDLPTNSHLDVATTLSP
jgi:hypothetical protein